MYYEVEIGENTTYPAIVAISPLATSHRMVRCMDPFPASLYLPSPSLASTPPRPLEGLRFETSGLGILSHSSPTVCNYVGDVDTSEVQSGEINNLVKPSRGHGRCEMLMNAHLNSEKVSETYAAS